MSDSTDTAPPASMEITLVVPAYNEEECIEDCVREADNVLAGLGRSYEILIVDDGSTDATYETLAALKKGYPALHVIRFLENQGQTAAMAAGFDHARGEIVFTIDADLQNDPADIPRLLEMIGEWDVVCGWREKRRDNWLRRISSRIANGIRNRLSHETIRDTGCTLKAFRREYLRRIKLFEGMHRFLPTLLRIEGARVTEIPVNHRPRFKGQTKYGVWNRVFKSLRDLFAVRWMQARHIHYEIRDEIK